MSKSKAINLNLINREVKAGRIYRRKHPTADLYIYNYAPEVQFGKLWNSATMAARGLILDVDGVVVARPFKKFFNLSEHGPSKLGTLRKKKFSVYEKMDGSLGILYFLEGEPCIATRGSFESTQAILATRIIQTKYSEETKRLVKGLHINHTLLFEIIYPENRIVVDYGDQEELYMLAVIDNATGEDVGYHPSDYPWPCVKRFEGRSFESIEDLAELEEKNKEGFVVQFTDGERVKIKFSDYIRLHRILTGINERRIWEHLRSGGLPKEILDRVPDEFYKWVTATVDKLRTQYKEIEDETLKVANFLRKDEHEGIFIPRKDQAAYIFKEHGSTSGIIFNIIDDKDYAKLIWKSIKPKPTPPFREGELEKLNVHN